MGMVRNVHFIPGEKEAINSLLRKKVMGSDLNSSLLYGEQNRGEKHGGREAGARQSSKPSSHFLSRTER